MTRPNGTTAGPVLVFDGDCGLCSSAARALARWVRGRGEDFGIEPYQALDLAHLGLTEEQCASSVQWVAGDGSVRSGEDAVASALRAGRGLAPSAGALIMLPGVHRASGVVYRWVSRNRYRLPGGTPACRARE